MNLWLYNEESGSKYQYETSPRKLKPEYEPQKLPNKKKTNNNPKKKSPTTKKEDNKVKKQKNERKQKAKLVLTVSLVFLILLAMSYRNTLIDDKFNDLQSLKKDLALLEKENEQLKVNIESMLNLNNIEQAAKERLGMQKLNNRQIVYVSLEKKDYVSSAVEEVQIEEEQSIFTKIIDAIKDSIM